MNHYHPHEFDVRCGDTTSAVDLNEPCTLDDCPFDDKLYVLTPNQLAEFVPAFLEGVANALEHRQEP